MRILMLSWEYPPRIVGGIARVVHDLAQSLGEKGNEVHVVTCWEPGACEYEKDKHVFVHRVRTYDVNPNNFIDWVLQLNFALLEKATEVTNTIGGFDIIHAHDWIVAFAARALKHSYKIPLVSTIHATEHGRNNGIYNDVQKYIHNVEWWLTYESWKVICNSNYMKSEIQNIFHLADEKIRIIYNGVDVNKFKGVERDYDFRRKYALDNEKIVFFVGRMVQEKGVKVLIDAMPKVLNYYHDAKLVIAGKGPQLDELKAQAHNMGLGNKVCFTGYISDQDLLKLYKCADITVFPSLYEPFGIVALEGMVANAPVVVSQAGGLGEIVNHGQDGMKAYTGNANSLADCILELLHNPGLCDYVKGNALNKVNTVYNWDGISNQVLDLYNQVTEEYKNSDWGMQKLNMQKMAIPAEPKVVKETKVAKTPAKKATEIKKKEVKSEKTSTKSNVTELKQPKKATSKAKKLSNA